MAKRLWSPNRVVVVVGAGGVVAAGLFLFGALVNKEWIPPSAGQHLWGAIAAAYQGYGFGFVLMVLALVGLLILHERVWLLVIKEKNKEIDRIAEQRNKLEDIILKDRGSSVGSHSRPRKGRQQH